MVRYVDDFLIVSDSEVQGAVDLNCVVSTCRRAGFAIQDSKVSPPSTVVQFLGIEIDAVNSILRISDSRLEEIRSLLELWRGRRSCSKRQLLQLIGKLAFVARVVRKGRAFLGRLIESAKKLKHLHFRTKLPIEAIRDIDWWRTSLLSHNGTSFFARDWASTTVKHVFTDASNYGFGACWGSEWFAMVYRGRFASLAERSINWRELHVAVKALATWAPVWANSAVIFHIDNQATCGILHKLYSPCSELMEFVRSWALILEEFRIDVRIEYISTVDNVLADALSRGAIKEFHRICPQASSVTWPSEVKYFNSTV